MSSQPFLFLLIFIPTIIWGQTSPQNPEAPCYPCRTPDRLCEFSTPGTACNEHEDDEDIFPKIENRIRNNNFYHSILYAQPPSLVSGARVSSFTFNTLGYQKKSFVLDADVNFPIAIGGPRFGLNTIHIIPRFKVRIFADDPNVPAIKGDTSLAVRTPSTIPGLAYYWSFDRIWNPYSAWSKTGKKYNPDDPNLKDNKYFGIYAFHHSDGQDGDEFYLTGDSSVNIYNGNYGEQIVFEFIYGQERLIQVDDYIPCENLSSRIERIRDFKKEKSSLFIPSSKSYQLNWRLSYEFHPYNLSNHAFRDLSPYGDFPDKAHMLGRHRLNGRATFSIIPSLVEFVNLNNEKWCQVTPEARYERWRMILDFSYILDGNYYRGQTIPTLGEVPIWGINRRMNLSLSGYFVLKRSKHAALFAEVGFHGSDRYNIYFNQSLFLFRYGLAFGFFDQYQAPEHRY